MRSSSKAALIIIGAAVPAFLLSRVIWPDPPGGPQPTPEQLPLFIGLAVMDALVFGAGVAYLALAWPKHEPKEERRLAILNYFAVGFLLASWWPHSNFHRVNEDLAGLLAIDYGFHVPLMLSAAVVALYSYRRLRKAAPSGAPSASPAAG